MHFYQQQQQQQQQQTNQIKSNQIKSGLHMSEVRMRSAFDSCLLTPEEMTAGPNGWTALKTVDRLPSTDSVAVDAVEAKAEAETRADGVINIVSTDNNSVSNTRHYEQNQLDNDNEYGHNKRHGLEHGHKHGLEHGHEHGHKHGHKHGLEHGLEHGHKHGHQHRHGHEQGDKEGRACQHGDGECDKKSHEIIEEGSSGHDHLHGHGHGHCDNDNHLDHAQMDLQLLHGLTHTQQEDASHLKRCADVDQGAETAFGDTEAFLLSAKRSREDEVERETVLPDKA